MPQTTHPACGPTPPTNITIKQKPVQQDISLLFGRMFVQENHDLANLAADNALATALYHQGHMTEAQQLYLRVLNSLRTQTQKHALQQRAVVHFNLGALFYKISRFEEAESHLQESARLYEHTQAQRWERNRVLTIQTLANTILQAGRPDEAVRTMRQTLQAVEAALGLQDNLTLQLTRALACLLHDARQLTAAREAFAYALTLHRNTLGPNQQHTIVVMEHFAQLLADLGDFAGCAQILQQAYNARCKRFGAQDISTLRTRNNLGYFLHKSGDHTNGLHVLRQTLTAQSQTLGTSDPDTLTTANNIGTALHQTGRHTEAVDVFVDTLHARGRVHGFAHEESLVALSNLATCLWRYGDMPYAQQILRQVLNDVRAQPYPGLDATNCFVAALMVQLGRVCARLGQMQEASSLASRGYMNLGNVLGYEHPLTQKGLHILMEVYRVLSGEQDL